MTIYRITHDDYRDESHINVGNPYEVYRDQNEINRFQVDFSDKALGAVTHALHPDKSEFNILELFCGNGGKARYVAQVLNELYSKNGKHVKFHLYGMDIVEELVVENSKRNEKFGYDGDMYVANFDNKKDIEELSRKILPNSIDMVISIKGLYNTFAKLDKSKASFLADIQSHNGILYLEQYCVKGLQANLIQISKALTGRKYGMCHYFDLYMCDRLLKKYGGYEKVFQSKNSGFDRRFFNHFLTNEHTFSKIFIKN